MVGAVGKGMVSLERIGSYIVRRLSHPAGASECARSLRPETRFGLEMPVRLVSIGSLTEARSRVNERLRANKKAAAPGRDQRLDFDYRVAPH